MTYITNKYYFENLFCRHTYKIKKELTLNKDIFNENIIEIHENESNKEILYLVLKVSDSIHSKFLKDESKYSSIYESYIHKSNQKEHSLENFKSLIKQYDLNKLKKNKIKIKKFKIKNENNFLVVDGLHRLSIYYHEINNESIKKKYIQIVK